MISGIYEMTRQSDRIRARCDGPQENGEIPPAAPVNWQEMFAAMETRLRRQDEELREFRRQAAQPVPEVAPPPVQAPAPVPVVEVNREPLFERFRKQHPPTFEGGTDPLMAEQWMDLISSTLDFMGVEGNDRVACASYMLRSDARIWWGVVAQMQDVKLMTWEQF